MPTGTAPQRAERERGRGAEKGEAEGRHASVSHSRGRTRGKQRNEMPGAPQRQRPRRCRRRASRRAPRTTRPPRRPRAGRPRARHARSSAAKIRPRRSSSQDTARERRSRSSSHERRHLARARVLELELLRPGEGGPPEELVDGDDHHDHRDDGRRHRPSVAAIDGDAHVGADAGQAEVVVAEREGLVHGEEEPAAGHRHHRVPHEADHRRRHLERAERFHQPKRWTRATSRSSSGNRAQRAVEREGHVPHLAGEDHQHAGELEPDVRVREQARPCRARARAGSRARGCPAGCRAAGSSPARRGGCGRRWCRRRA